MTSNQDILENEFAGFGRRTNGSCLTEESECGPTARGQHACCPEGMFCQGESNTVCCPTDDDCTDLFLVFPRCADYHWNMYNNTTPFCCSDDAVAAYNTSLNSNICADPGFQKEDDDKRLFEIEPSDDDRGDETTSSTSSPAPTGPLDATDSLSPVSSGTESAEPEDSTNTGAIAGGVVGGVVGLGIILVLFWFLRRRTNRKKGVQQGQQGGPPAFTLPEKDSNPHPVTLRPEMDTTSEVPRVSELGNSEQGSMTGHYRSSEHQRPGELAELR